MAQLNPEAEAQKTVAMFRDSAECKTNLSHVWDEMAKESKGFGGGTAQDKAYFDAVAKGLQQSGLMPELTIQYARMHHDELMGDNDQIGKHEIAQWQHDRKQENHRITPVEQALIDNLKNNFDAIKDARRFGQRGTDGITDTELNNYQASRSQERHAREAGQAQQQQTHNEAADIYKGMTANNSELFQKLSDHGVITQDSIDRAIAFDDDERTRHGYKGKSYLNGQDRHVILELEQHMDDMTKRRGARGGTHSDDRVTQADIANYAQQNGAK